MANIKELCDQSIENVLHADLSRDTRQSYEDCYTNIRRWFPDAQSILHVVQTPDRFYRKLLQMYGNRGTIRKHLVACLALFKHNTQLRLALPEVHIKLGELLKEVSVPLEEKLKSNKPSDTQLQQYVEYSVALAKYEKLERGSIDALLLGLYVLLPPKRNDYWNARVYVKNASHVDQGNYFLIDYKETPTAPKESWLVMNDYKTSSSYGTLKEQVPPRLIHEIKLSLKKQPRSHLFLDKNGQPYVLPKSFANFASNRLSNIFGKRVSLTMFRHAYCTKIRNTDMSTELKEKLAHSMGHSLSMQTSYGYKQTFCQPRRLDDTCKRISDNEHGIAIPTSTVTTTTPAPPPVDADWIPKQYQRYVEPEPETYVVRKMTLTKPVDEQSRKDTVVI